jgi:5-methylcytosine-specific restriction endonuclease McrA
MTGRARGRDRNSWADAIETVLRREAGPLHVTEIARRIVARGLKPANRNVRQTVSGIAQQLPARFARVAPATFNLALVRRRRGASASAAPGLSGRRGPLVPEARQVAVADPTVLSMISIKAGSQLPQKVRNGLLRRPGARCEICHGRADLQVDHQYPKAQLLRDIVRQDGLRLGPKAPIENALRALRLLLEHPKFHNKRHLRVLCRRCNNASR